MKLILAGIIIAILGVAIVVGITQPTRVSEVERPDVDGLRDCHMFEFMKGFTTVYALRCPMSNTSISTEKQSGKTRSRAYSVTNEE